MKNIDKYTMGDFLGLSMIAPGAVSAACTDDYPVQIIESIGGGQNAAVNKTLSLAFSGHFMTTDGLVNRGKNVVKICPGTEVGYLVSNTVGEPTIVTEVTFDRARGYVETQIEIPPEADCSTGAIEGYLAIGDKISCNNKIHGGTDTDTFTIKAGR